MNESIYVYDEQLDKLVWVETAIQMIINNELEDKEEGHPNKSNEEIEEHVIDNIDDYLDFYGYRVINEDEEKSLIERGVEC